MTAAHWHLVLNHVPVFGTFFGILILIIGLVKKNLSMEKLGYIIFIVTSLITIPAFLTGEPAEHMIEKIADVSHSVIHEHEEIAEKAFVLSNILGVLSLLALVILAVKSFKFRRVSQMIVCVLGLLTFGFMVYAAYEGGKIRRPELQNETLEMERS